MGFVHCNCLGTLPVGKQISAVQLIMYPSRVFGVNPYVGNPHLVPTLRLDFVSRSSVTAALILSRFSHPQFCSRVLLTLPYHLHLIRRPTVRPAPSALLPQSRCTLLPPLLVGRRFFRRRRCCTASALISMALLDRAMPLATTSCSSRRMRRRLPGSPASVSCKSRSAGAPGT
jgi:hypothetical protein